MDDIVSPYLTHLGLTRSDDIHGLVNAMVQGHLSRFTFNNIAVLLREDKPLPLDIDHLFNKIVHRHRGGYCFEHNKLMYCVLHGMGLTVTPLLGRVLFGGSNDMPRTHRVTQLSLNGADYLVDVGFGPYAPMAMIPFSGKVTECPNGGIYRLVKDGPHSHRLERKGSDGFMVLYTFDRMTFTDADFEVAHFYSYQHPQATFVRELRVSRVDTKRTLSLRNRTLSVIGTDREEIPIQSADHLQQVLAQYFDLTLTPAESQRLYRKTATEDPPE